MLAYVYCYVLYMPDSGTFVAINAESLDDRTRNAVVGYFHEGCAGVAGA